MKVHKIWRIIVPEIDDLILPWIYMVDVTFLS